MASLCGLRYCVTFSPKDSERSFRIAIAKMLASMNNNSETFFAKFFSYEKLVTFRWRMTQVQSGRHGWKMKIFSSKWRVHFNSAIGHLPIVQYLGNNYKFTISYSYPPQHTQHGIRNGLGWSTLYGSLQDSHALSDACTLHHSRGRNPSWSPL